MPAASCTLSTDFSPLSTAAVGVLQENLPLTDNSLNATPATQSIALTGTSTATQAMMTSPTPGSTFTGSGATFTWNAAIGATGYALWLGTTGVGSHDLLEGGIHTATSLTFTTMPLNGVTIYVRLWTSVNGALLSNDYTYTAANGEATMTSPTPNSTFTGSSVTFNWSAISGATGYALWIGTTGIGSHDLLYGGIHTATSLTFTAMPVSGAMIYVRLYTSINGTLQPVDYSYTAASLAAITSPAPLSTFTGPSATFNWTTVTGATGYALWIGTTGIGSNDLLEGGIHATTSLTFASLPTTGGTVYVRLYTDFNGALFSNDYTYNEVQPATMSSPTPLITLPGPSTTFAWTTANGATGYALWIGTTGVGSHDLLEGGIHTATSLTFNSLPTTGGTVYVRLYTDFNGVLLFSDYTYTAAP
jgi:hypothetical protein